MKEVMMSFIRNDDDPKFIIGVLLFVTGWFLIISML